MDPLSPAAGNLTDVERDVLGQVLGQNAALVTAGLGAASGGERPPVLEALAAARSTGLVLEDIVRILVRQARAEGHAWAAVGDILHVTRQAAYQKFGSDEDPGDGVTEVPAAAVAGAAETAAAVIADFAAGRWPEMRERFDARMQDACSAGLLDSVRSRLAAELGELRRTRRPVVTVRGRYTVVDVPLVLERGVRKGRVTLNGDGRVAGFFVLVPEAP
jgi:hypothetical protein